MPCAHVARRAAAMQAASDAGNPRLNAIATVDQPLKLPKELLLGPILYELPMDTLITFSETCHQARNASQPIIWQHVFCGSDAEAEHFYRRMMWYDVVAETGDSILSCPVPHIKKIYISAPCDPTYLQYMFYKHECNVETLHWSRYSLMPPLGFRIELASTLRRLEVDWMPVFDQGHFLDELVQLESLRVAVNLHYQDRRCDKELRRWVLQPEWITSALIVRRARDEWDESWSETLIAQSNAEVLERWASGEVTNTLRHSGARIQQMFAEMLAHDDRMARQAAGGAAATAGERWNTSLPGAVRSREERQLIVSRATPRDRARRQAAAARQLAAIEMAIPDAIVLPHHRINIENIERNMNAALAATGVYIHDDGLPELPWPPRRVATGLRNLELTGACYTSMGEDLLAALGAFENLVQLAIEIKQVDGSFPLALLSCRHTLRRLRMILHLSHDCNHRADGGVSPPNVYEREMEPQRTEGQVEYFDCAWEGFARLFERLDGGRMEKLERIEVYATRVLPGSFWSFLEQTPSLIHAGHDASTPRGNRGLDSFLLTDEELGEAAR